MTFFQATFVLAIFAHIRNISAVTDPILTKIFRPNLLTAVIFWDQNFFGPKILWTLNFFHLNFWTHIFLDFKFLWPTFFWTSNFFRLKFYWLKIFDQNLVWTIYYLTYQHEITLLNFNISAITKQDLGLKCSAWKVFGSKDFGLVGL